MNTTQDLGAVPVHREPRHQVVYESSAARVLDVQIPPGDTTLFHAHGTPIHYVQVVVTATAVQVAGADWQSRAAEPGWIGQAWSTISYVEQPLTHRVRNIGAATYRLIAVESLGEGAPASDTTSSMSVEFEESNRWFRRRRVTLRSGETSKWETASRPLCLVQTRVGQLHLEDREGGQHQFTAFGQSLVVEVGTSYYLSNVGRGTVELVMVEVR